MEIIKQTILVGEGYTQHQYVGGQYQSGLGNSQSTYQLQFVTEQYQALIPPNYTFFIPRNYVIVLYVAEIFLLTPVYWVYGQSMNSVNEFSSSWIVYGQNELILGTVYMLRKY